MSIDPIDDELLETLKHILFQSATIRQQLLSMDEALDLSIETDSLNQ